MVSSRSPESRGCWLHQHELGCTVGLRQLSFRKMVLGASGNVGLNLSREARVRCVDLRPVCRPKSRNWMDSPLSPPPRDYRSTSPGPGPAALALPSVPAVPQPSVPWPSALSLPPGRFSPQPGRALWHWPYRGLAAAWPRPAQGPGGQLECAGLRVQDDRAGWGQEPCRLGRSQPSIQKQAEKVSCSLQRPAKLSHTPRPRSSWAAGHKCGPETRGGLRAL